jgi:Flp pilus assembly protein TadD
VRRVEELRRELFLAGAVRDALAATGALGGEQLARALALAGGLVDDPLELAREAWLIARAPEHEPRELERARAMAEACLASSPEDPTALRALAAALVRLGRTAEALERLARLRELAPGDPAARVLRALALARAGRAEEGRRELAEAGEVPAAAAHELGPLSNEAKAALSIP